MINRKYLPYKSAQEYIDRGMAKWMGFYFSEHSSALEQEMSFNDVTSPILDEDEKMLFLSFAYLNNKKVLLYTTLQSEPLLGKIYDMTVDRLYLSMEKSTPNFLYSQIRNLSIQEVLEND